MEPEAVIVRAFGGVAWTRWIVEVAARSVYVTNQEGREAVQRGEVPLALIGVPLYDVFALADVQDGSTPDWESLEPRFRRPVTTGS
jgi:hypothetical protein